MDFQTLIIDDEQYCVNSLKHSVLNNSRLLYAGGANDLKTGKELVFKIKPDLLFLDIEFPEGSGIEFLHDIHGMIDWNMEVVFYTAYDKYLLDALRQSAFDYLLKPYKEEEFKLIIERFLKKTLSPHRDRILITDALSQLLPENKSILFPTLTGYQFLRLQQIGFFEYESKYKNWTMYLSDGRNYALKQRTKSESLLKLSPIFTQINQQTIVNTDYLWSIDNNMHCVLLPPFDQIKSLTVSRLYFKTLHDRFSTL